jgi:hypothetical protein
MKRKDLIEAVAYLRTPSAANVGADKDVRHTYGQSPIN